MRIVFKGLLGATAMSPIALIYAAKSFEATGDTGIAVLYCAIAIGLIAICFGVLRIGISSLERFVLKFNSAKSIDRESLTILFAYLLPLVSAKVVDLEQYPLTRLLVFSIIFMAVCRSNAYQFNPLLGLMGYYSYEVQRSDDGLSATLITRLDISKKSGSVSVVQLFQHVFLVVDEEIQ